MLPTRARRVLRLAESSLLPMLVAMTSIVLAAWAFIRSQGEPDSYVPLYYLLVLSVALVVGAGLGLARRDGMRTRAEMPHLRVNETLPEGKALFPTMRSLVDGADDVLILGDLGRLGDEGRADLDILLRLGGRIRVVWDRASDHESDVSRRSLVEFLSRSSLARGVQFAAIDERLGFRVLKSNSGRMLISQLTHARGLGSSAYLMIERSDSSLLYNSFDQYAEDVWSRAARYRSHSDALSDVERSERSW